jgi:hypothetical protein
VDLTRDPCPLLGDRPPELGRADRAPDSDEQDPGRDQAKHVRMRDVVARERRREDAVQLGEQPDGRAEGEPAVEILAVSAVAEPESDHRDQAQHRLQGKRGREQSRLAAGGVERRQRCLQSTAEAPDRREHQGSAVV